MPTGYSIGDDHQVTSTELVATTRSMAIMSMELRLLGGDGNDEIYGGNNGDCIQGGTGDDVIYAWNDAGCETHGARSR